jgi:transposase, IS6 family
VQHRVQTAEVSTDRAPDPRVPDELQYGTTRSKSIMGRLKSWLRPLRGLKRLRSAALISAGHAFVQNLRRGHYELATMSIRNIGSQRPSLKLPTPSDRDANRG